LAEEAVGIDAGLALRACLIGQFYEKMLQGSGSLLAKAVKLLLKLLLRGEPVMPERARPGGLRPEWLWVRRDDRARTFSRYRLVLFHRALQPSCDARPRLLNVGGLRSGVVWHCVFPPSLNQQAQLKDVPRMRGRMAALR
jgi:hypothetical protein